MGKLHLYPEVKIIRQSSKGRKLRTVPNQSLSLREIIRRFIRRESLPVHMEGVYEERFGDLEKMSKADIVEQMETVESLKSSIDDFKKRRKKADDDAQKKEDEEKKKAATAAQPVEPPAGGVTTSKNPPEGA